MSAEEFVRQYIAGTEKLTDAYGYNPAEETRLLRRGLWSWRWTASDGATSWWRASMR